MGNVAICLINNTISATDYVYQKRRLHTERQRIQSLIPRYLTRLYQRDPTITSLHLSDLGVDCPILRLLSKPLISGDTLVTELYLDNNRIGPEGATVIARILNRNKHLKIVSLAHNEIGSVGAMAIASALESNTTLVRLNLAYCNIDDSGIEKLAKSLKSNSTLKYLNLEGNYISSNGVHSLLQCVYDTTGGIRSLWESNHSLRAFYGQRPIYSASFPETATNRRLMKQLGEILATCNRRGGAGQRQQEQGQEIQMLTERGEDFDTEEVLQASPTHVTSFPTPSISYYYYNRSNNDHNGDSNYNNKSSSKKTAAGRKIYRYYLKDQRSEYLECIQNMETKLVPYVTGWLGRYGNLGVIYTVVRDMPWLLERMHTDDKSTASSKTNDFTAALPMGKNAISGKGTDATRNTKRKSGVKIENANAIVDIVVEEEMMRAKLLMGEGGEMCGKKVEDDTTGQE